MEDICIRIHLIVYVFLARVNGDRLSLTIFSYAFLPDDCLKIKMT